MTLSMVCWGLSATTAMKCISVGGMDPRNSELFITELNEEQVNTVVSQFGSKPRFHIQPMEWYRGANLTNMSAVYEV